MKMEAQKAVDINDAICEHVSGTFRLILRYGMSGVVLERLNSIQEYIAIFQSKAPSAFVSCLLMTCN